MLKVPDGTIRILVQGSQRVRLGDYVTERPYLVARITEMPDVVEETPELEALTRNVQKTFSDIIEQIPYLPEELQLAVTNVDEPSALSHLIAGALRVPTEEKQLLLEEVDVAKRLRMLSEILARELEVIQLGSQIQSEVQSSIDKGQREYFLREQLKAIQAELGEEDEQAAEINELRERIEAAGLPDHAHQAAEREPTWSGWSTCPGRRTPRTTSTSSTPARSSTPTTTTWRRSRTASSSTWRSAS
jgi:ATP-dependent Lon protease